MVYYNLYAANDTDAAAKSLNGGSDIDLGDMYFPPCIINNIKIANKKKSSIY